MQNTSNIIRNTGTKLIPISRLLTMPKRAHPDHGYSVYKTVKEVKGKDPKTGHNIYEGNVVTTTGKELPQHENSHYIVRDNETGKDVGILTSAKDPKKGNINIASENVNGDVLANGKQKAQQYRSYEEPRDTRTCTGVVKDEVGTAFAKKYDKELNDAVKKSTNHNKPALARIDKDSSQLYHENGLPIYNKDGKEIEYDLD